MSTSTDKSIPTWGEVLKEINGHIIPSDTPQFFLCKNNGVLVDYDSSATYTVDDFFGVGVVSKDASFVMPKIVAPVNVTNDNRWGISNSNLIIGECATPEKDFDGWGNTNKIWPSMYGGPYSYAGLCYAQKGYLGLPGYLPSFGEGLIILRNMSKISPMLTKIAGMVGIGSNSYMITSTECNAALYYAINASKITSLDCYIRANKISAIVSGHYFIPIFRIML